MLYFRYHLFLIFFCPFTTAKATTYYVSDTGSDAHNRTFRTDTNYLNLGIKCRWNSWQMADYDHNFYYHAWRDSMLDFTYRPNDINEQYSALKLQDWQLFSSQDSNAVSHSFYWPLGVDYSMFVYNETDSVASKPLTGRWLDFDSVFYQGNIILAPFEGKVLWQTADCNAQIGGTAFIDSCAVCAGGATGITPILDASLCFTKTETISNRSIDIFPNPTYKSLTVSASIKTIDKIELYGIDGRLISCPIQSFQDYSVVDVSKLKIGTYILKVYVATAVISSKFIKIN